MKFKIGLIILNGIWHFADIGRHSKLFYVPWIATFALGDYSFGARKIHKREGLWPVSRARALNEPTKIKALRRERATLQDTYQVRTIFITERP